MKNYKITMSYDGTNYHGFQRQDNAYTVQEAVETALFKLTGERVSVAGCSRTDTGVHAREFVFSVKLESPITSRGIVFGTNNLLSGDIALRSCEEAPDVFHARYDCVGKEYEYLVHNSEIKNPFLFTRAYKHWFPIDAQRLNEAAQSFVGTHDFKSFCAAACTKENTVRTIHSFSVTRQGDLVSFLISGDGFLYNMVRILVGTLLFVNDGKIAADALPGILAEKNRTCAGKTVPAHGLYLNRVFYK
ncbi:MAG: tRNA pseudouridine(38-40) synthase TruA [Oscillospiraceae bacterium]